MFVIVGIAAFPACNLYSALFNLFPRSKPSACEANLHSSLRTLAADRAFQMLEPPASLILAAAWR
jgi:hypothetical protein